MREIVEEYGTSLLALTGGIAIIGFVGYAFCDGNGSVSAFFGKLVELYL